ncbi:YbaB/EbfC family nucleoid-associated protein [uncultured Ruminococcus sp.]|uniref:YbaB/EbfC family nucleoid-associated protein n=1 Tax=uncultured Ruminococcus sp. TaxID=165186 RepID=UPI00292D7AEE|nr:YbaB/EbfC family nucleoid-associated protein [uncultured Ruminococcus sp.]
MKARLPQGYGGGGAQNIQQLARQAQKMQEQMESATEELNAKEYSASAGGGMVNVTVSGELEVKKLEISPDVVDPEDIEMLQDLVTAAVNEAIRKANTDKEETMDKISGGMNLGGLGGLF